VVELVGRVAKQKLRFGGKVRQTQPRLDLRLRLARPTHIIMGSSGGISANFFLQGRTKTRSSLMRFSAALANVESAVPSLISGTKPQPPVEAEQSGNSQTTRRQDQHSPKNARAPRHKDVRGASQPPQELDEACPDHSRGLTSKEQQDTESSCEPHDAAPGRRRGLKRKDKRDAENRCKPQDVNQANTSPCSGRQAKRRRVNSCHDEESSMGRALPPTAAFPFGG